jgi:hypothetical protein
VAALEKMGVEAQACDGAKICFDEEYMPRFPGWLTARQSLLWTRKHLYYKKLKIPFFKVRNMGEFMSVPYGVFWIKPSVSHRFSGKFKRALVTSKTDFIMNFEFFDGRTSFVCMEPMPSEEQVWVMTLWDSHGRASILWYSTEKIHASHHPMDRVISCAIMDIGKKLGLKKWMTFMEFCTFRGSAHFIDLNPRLPGDDDWHEFVWKHISGRSLGEDIANLFVADKLPPIIKSKNVVLESEWDGGQISGNQMVWNVSDGYKVRPLLTFIKNS